MNISGILFDLEGVLLRAKTHEVLAGAREALAYCGNRGLPFRIISNNTVQTPQALLELLSERDMDVAPEQLLTPLKFLETELETARSALVIGSKTLSKFVEERGIAISDGADVDLVICGGGYTVTNEILYAATLALVERKSRFVCLHRNRIFNDASGVTRPDVGCVVVGLEYSTGHQAKTLGKPSPEYFVEAMRGWNVEPEQVLLISDDPISDLGGGKAVGFQTGFVHTGKYDAASTSGLAVKPDRSWSDLDVAFAELAGHG